MSRIKAFRYAVVAACLWEAGAICLNKPTWTHCIYGLRRRGRHGHAVVALVWGALTYHFLIEGE